MENPFVRLMKLGESSAESKKVTDTNFEIRDDGVYVQDVFEGGSVGEWNMIYNNPADSMGSRSAYEAYRKSRGLMNKSDFVKR